jgi:hypothetical protein
MKEATGELNMTVVTIIAIGAIIAFFWVMWPQIKNTIGNTWNSVSNEGATTCGEQQYWDGHKCVSAK